VEPEPFELGEHLVDASGKLILTRILTAQVTYIIYYFGVSSLAILLLLCISYLYRQIKILFSGKLQVIDEFVVFLKARSVKKKKKKNSYKFKFTRHVMHRAHAKSNKMNNDRADGHCYSFA